ncbi:odorant receptor 46a-like isoform X2 [Cydia pomonella]|uniref:Odorant receptor n=1 Tax=Cydia pomonella TaxID=82600 RepID=H9A5P9_CYDPO|nr:odorant receptor 46a-like isoform X2 [Cydia pomonella]AFC91739.1 putative odorant receptor OR57 [Cydia pomonella]
MTTTYSTFEAFRPHFNALAYVAYFKIIPKPSSGVKHTLHTVYRAVVWFLVIIYNLQHVIRVIQARHSTEQAVNTLFVLLTTINTLGKQVAFNSRVERVDRLVATIEGPLFMARNTYDEKVLRSNAWIMSRLLMMYHGSIYLCGAMWGISPLVSKLSGEVELTGYFPFDTSGWLGFGIAVAFNTIVITLQGYAHVTMDCTIVSLHAQTKVQLQMLRNSLEHLTDSVGKTGREICVQSTVYKDIEDTAFGVVLKKRLTRCVEHYKLIVWFHSEVEAVFSEAMIVQFFVIAWVICMTVYKIAGLSLVSAEFFSMFVYLGCMLGQLFIYCYYGTQVKAESEFINYSIYRCDWVSLSPRFRALLLILMSRGMRPVAPRIAYIIPMSIETYISVLRSSYTLLTFLERK